jgi:hypothetical protein
LTIAPNAARCGKLDGPIKCCELVLQSEGDTGCTRKGIKKRKLRRKKEENKGGKWENVREEESWKRRVKRGMLEGGK